jgi:hypothetical protein
VRNIWQAILLYPKLKRLKRTTLHSMMPPSTSVLNFDIWGKIASKQIYLNKDSLFIHFQTRGRFMEHKVLSQKDNVLRLLSVGQKSPVWENLGRISSLFCFDKHLNFLL